MSLTLKFYIEIACSLVIGLCINIFAKAIINWVWKSERAYIERNEASSNLPKKTQQIARSNLYKLIQSKDIHIPSDAVYIAEKVRRDHAA